MSRKKSPHILNTSANLLGFSLIILTSVRLSRVSESSLLDEIAAVAVMFLVISCLLSFLSIRTEDETLGMRFETIADYSFLVALLLLAASAILISFDLLL